MDEYHTQYKNFYQDKSIKNKCTKCKGNLTYHIFEDELKRNCDNCDDVFKLKIHEYMNIDLVKKELETSINNSYDKNTIQKLQKLYDSSANQYLKQSKAKDKYYLVQKYIDEKLRIKAKQTEIRYKMKNSELYDEGDIKSYISLNQELMTITHNLKDLFDNEKNPYIRL